jgi:hypothetical protein
LELEECLGTTNDVTANLFYFHARAKRQSVSREFGNNHLKQLVMSAYHAP